MEEIVLLWEKEVYFTVPDKQHILFVCPYPFDEAPSQRFRYEQYLPHLSEVGFSYTLAPFLSENAWKLLYTKGNLLRKIFAILNGFAKRKWLLLSLKPYDYIFIHREATPVGPPFFEWAVKYIWRKPIIYDFDDAIWLEDANEKGSIKSFMKWKSKVSSICKWSEKVSCGNQYLANYASLFNSNVVINPTTIDTQHLHVPIDKAEKELVIGWTGTHSTLFYLESIIELLKKLYQKHSFKLLVIANQAPNFTFPNMEFRHWNKATEIADLQRLDIGLMPLSNDAWSEGKCGFKALQYMALEKAVVGSPVGVNKTIIPAGGYLVDSEQEWIQSLEVLISDKFLRKKLGEKAREYIKNYYSVQSNKDNYLSLFVG